MSGELLAIGYVIIAIFMCGLFCEIFRDTTAGVFFGGFWIITIPVCIGCLIVMGIVKLGSIVGEFVNKLWWN